MGDVEGELGGDARRHRLGGEGIAVEGDGDPRRRRIGDAVVEHAELDGLVLADDAEARRGVDDDAAVLLAVVAGEEDVERAGAGHVGALLRHVVDLAVGQHDHRADAVGRHVGKGVAERAEEMRAVGGDAAAGVDGAHVEVAEIGETLQKRVLRLGRRLVASVERLAGALVGDHGDDGRQRIAILAKRHRVEEGEEEESRGECAPEGAPHAADEAGEDEDERGDADGGEQPEGQERLEGEGPVHWPSLSRSAGTWTWSAL